MCLPDCAVRRGEHLSRVDERAAAEDGPQVRPVERHLPRSPVDVDRSPVGDPHVRVVEAAAVPGVEAAAARDAHLKERKGLITTIYVRIVDTSVKRRRRTPSPAGVGGPGGGHDQEEDLLKNKTRLEYRYISSPSLYTT